MSPRQALAQDALERSWPSGDFTGDDADRARAAIMKPSVDPSPIVRAAARVVLASATLKLEVLRALQRDAAVLSFEMEGEFDNRLLLAVADLLDATHTAAFAESRQ